MPMKLGAPLATTTFAGIASAQLLLCFAAWSPLGTEFFYPPLWLKEFMAVAYAGAWLLLIQSMREAGTGLQTGSLGWRSVWLNRPVQYPAPPVDKPLHRIIRHPIYASFALILWTSPVFSIEKIIFASVWTVYCVAGSKLKELRLRRFNPGVYASYCKTVPFWIPSFKKANGVTAATGDHHVDADVIVAGGGPVGLLLANLLGKAGRRVLVLEAGTSIARRSMAIGITPPSLDVLASLELDRMFIAQGIRVTHAEVRENRTRVYALDFSTDDQYPFILTIPQSDTTRILRENLQHYPSVSVRDGHVVQAVHQERDQIHIVTSDQSGSRHEWTAGLVAACDGAHSPITGLLGIGQLKQFYAPEFIMADFVDRSGLGNEAHLFFGSERPVESFPLPGGRRRWIVRSGWRGVADLGESIAAAVTRLTGISIDAGDQLDQSAFRPFRKLVRRYYRGRVALCGDAAHVMSPIGGQGMNTGFADAAFLAHAFDSILNGRGQATAWLRVYDRKRRHAFRLAAARAAAGMTLGVLRGSLWSSIRGRFLRILDGVQASRMFVTRWFTMRSLPAVQQQVAFARRHINGASTPL